MYLYIEIPLCFIVQVLVEKCAILFINVCDSFTATEFHTELTHYIWTHYTVSLTIMNIQHEGIEMDSFLFGQLNSVIEEVHQHRFS